MGTHAQAGATIGAATRDAIQRHTEGLEYDPDLVLRFRAPKVKYLPWVVEELDEYTLVECRLETGRTHQVRIHLGERGTPLCGERVYDRPLNGQPLPDRSKARRPVLHAAYLALDHPRTKKRVEWHAEMPGDMKDLIKRLRVV